MGKMAYSRELRHHNSQCSQKVDRKVCNVVVRVVCADQEKDDWHTQKKLLGWGVLITAVDLFPHVEVVVCAGVELEWYAAYPVKHQKGAKHVGDVDKKPRGFLGDGWDDVE